MRFSITSLLLLCFATVIVESFVPKSRLAVAPVSKSTRLFYDIQRDPQPNDNVWSILSNTEKWISNTLNSAQIGDNNPLSRKEVSYVCETSKDPAIILANIFRKIKEARQLGESHAQDQEELIDEHGENKHNRVTLRQTQILVIPSNEELNQNYPVFDAVIDAVNLARRSARDLITDHSLEKLDEKLYGDGEDRDWVVSVNCAHLHPKYGEKSPEQELKEMEEQEKHGEVDLNLEMYKKQRLVARRSPYPSVVIEVRSMAPPEYTPPPPTGPVSPKSIDEIDIGEGESESFGGAENTKIDADFVNQLEALFSKSSLDSRSSAKGDGDFYESIGSHIETFSSVTPLMVAQNWIDGNDPLFDVTQCSFTVSDTTHVDEAYEFLFTNLGMQTSQFLVAAGKVPQTATGDAQKRQYMVLPHFLSSSATSLEKFTKDAGRLIRALPSLRNKVELTNFHPEGIDESKRCPVPVIVLQWRA
jgi:hypothetical protein